MDNQINQENNQVEPQISTGQPEQPNQQSPVTAPAPEQPRTYSPQVMMKDPTPVKKWNWGAFAFNMWWGIGNKCYLPLLCLIPLFGFVWMFICGAKGNEWAYVSGNYDSPEDFMKRQESWNRAGFVYFIVMAALIVLYSLIFIPMIVSMMSGLYYPGYYL